MSRYLVRVELHDAKWPDDYIKILHPAMQNEGFSKTITGTDGKIYELPTAEYFKFSSETIQQIGQRVAKAAATTKKKFGYIVTEANFLSWDGLPVVSR